MACEDERKRCEELATAAISDIAENGVPALVELLLFARAEVAGTCTVTVAGPEAEELRQELVKHQAEPATLLSTPSIMPGGASSYEAQRVALGYPKRGHYGD